MAGCSDRLRRGPRTPPSEEDELLRDGQDLDDFGLIGSMFSEDSNIAVRSASPGPPMPGIVQSPSKSAKSAKSPKRKSGKRAKRGRAFCFTNWEAADYDWKAWLDNNGWADYLLIGRETCPTTKLEHWQGYVHANGPKSWAMAKDSFSKETHVEIAKGGFAANFAYCTKAGNWREYGVRPATGRRTDLAEFRRALDADGTRTMQAAYNIDFGLACQYRAGIQDYQNRQLHAAAKTRIRKVKCSVYHGLTGTGKTRAAFEAYPGAYLICGSDLAWWAWYEQEEVCIIDEYSNDIKITELLKLIDIYPKRLNVKGGSTMANWSTVIITTNLEPHRLHASANARHRQALSRRIWEWVEFKADGTRVVRKGKAQESELYRESEERSDSVSSAAATSIEAISCPMLDVDMSGFIFEDRPRLFRSHCETEEDVMMG